MVVFLGEVEEGVSNSGIVWDKATIEVGKAKEGSYIFDFGRGGPAGNSIKFYWVHGKLSWFDYYAEIFNLQEGKLALLQFQVEVQFLHPLQHLMSSLDMGGLIRGECEEIVHVDDKPSFSDHVSEGVIYEALECGGDQRI